jgi:recombination protein RecA
VAAAQWSRSRLSGSLAELSTVGGAGALTLAFELVLDAQHEGETVAWVGGSGGGFYPPDAAGGGVDLDALIVVRAPDLHAMLRAGDRLVRSGGFGLVVLDLGRDPRLTSGSVARLAGLARRHDTAVLCLTEKSPNSPSLGSMVAVRGEAVRERSDDGRFLCRVNVLKDKKRPPGWTHGDLFQPPPGLG